MTKTYVVNVGDTLWGIAKAQLGHVARYAEIVQHNHLKTATLQPGQTLQIPEKEAQ